MADVPPLGLDWKAQVGGAQPIVGISHVCQHDVSKLVDFRKQARQVWVRNHVEDGTSIVGEVRVDVISFGPPDAMTAKGEFAELQPEKKGVFSGTTWNPNGSACIPSLISCTT